MPRQPEGGDILKTPCLTSIDGLPDGVDVAMMGKTTVEGMGLSAVVSVGSKTDLDEGPPGPRGDARVLNARDRRGAH